MPDTLCQIETSLAGRTVMQRSQPVSVPNPLPSNHLSKYMTILECFKSQSGEIIEKIIHSYLSRKKHQIVRREDRQCAQYPQTNITSHHQSSIAKDPV